MLIKNKLEMERKINKMVSRFDLINIDLKHSLNLFSKLKIDLNKNAGEIKEL